jgi:phosphoenolpyruvate synthase/pyruvate phosphate dikinase
VELLRDFAELGRADIAIAGGKGANLGELVRAGLDVPPGFVLTTDAYRRFVAENGIDVVRPPELIRDQLTSGTVSEDLRRSLLGRSIVAREYGIPAVLGTGVATRKIPDGARIRLDGDRGRGRLLDTAEADTDGPDGVVGDGGTRRSGVLVVVVGVAAAALVGWLLVRRRRGRYPGAGHRPVG